MVNKMLVVIVLVPGVLQLVKGQVQFNQPFECKAVQQVEVKEFDNFLKNRYRQFASVYQYEEGAKARYWVCSDSMIDMDLEYALLFKKALVRKEVVDDVIVFVRRCVGANRLVLVGMTELIYQAYLEGRYSQLDSIAVSLDWSVFSSLGERGIFARRLFFLLNGVTQNTEVLADLQRRFNPTDSVVAFYRKDDLTLAGLGRYVVSLYDSLCIIEANVMFDKIFKQYYTGPARDIFIGEMKIAKRYVGQLGFEVNHYELGNMYGGFENVTEPQMSYLNYLIDHEDLGKSSGGWVGEVFVWSMFGSLVVFVGALGFYLYMRYRWWQVMKRRILDEQAKMDGVRISSALGRGLASGHAEEGH